MRTDEHRSVEEALEALREQVRGEAGQIQVVGRALTPAEDARLKALREVESLLDQALDALAGEQPLSVDEIPPPREVNWIRERGRAVREKDVDRYPAEEAALPGDDPTPFWTPTKRELAGDDPTEYYRREGEGDRDG